MTRRSSRIAAPFAAAVAFWVSIGHAEHASVTLSYSNAKGTTPCPDEATFRGLVAARLGYDPFAGATTRALAVAFERRGNEIVGRLSFASDRDDQRTERTLRAGVADCFELATSMALVTALTLDPSSLHSRPEPEPEPQPARPAPTPAAPAPAPAPTPTPAPPARSPVSARLELAALVPVGIVPAPRGGARAGAHLDFGVWSLGAEGAFLFPSSRDNPAGAGAVSAHVLSGSLAPCVQPLDGEAWVLDLCAVGSVGVLRSTAENVTRAAATSDLFATVGPRAGLAVMLSRGFSLGFSADAPVALSRVHLNIEDQGTLHEVWATPALGFIGAVSLIARLE